LFDLRRVGATKKKRVGTGFGETRRGRWIYPLGWPAENNGHLKYLTIDSLNDGSPQKLRYNNLVPQDDMRNDGKRRQDLAIGTRVRFIAGKYLNFGGKVTGLAGGLGTQVYVRLEPPPHDVRVPKTSVRPEAVDPFPHHDSLQDFLLANPDLGVKMEELAHKMWQRGLLNAPKQVREGLKSSRRTAGFAPKSEAPIDEDEWDA